MISFMETGRFRWEDWFGYHWSNLENKAIFQCGALGPLCHNFSEMIKKKYGKTEVDAFP